MQILVVQQRQFALLDCVELLKHAGISVTAVCSVNDAITELASKECGVVVVNLEFSADEMLRLFEGIRAVEPRLPTVLLKAGGDDSGSSGSVESDVYETVRTPCAPRLLIEAIRRAAEVRSLTQEIAALKSRLDARHGTA